VLPADRSYDGAPAQTASRRKKFSRPLFEPALPDPKRKFRKLEFGLNSGDRQRQSAFAADLSRKSESATQHLMDAIPALVYRLAYNGDIAVGQLAVFQGASEASLYNEDLAPVP
jgi:hypothetical protein